MREQVDDLDDPRLADYRNLPDATLFRERGVFVAEGRLVVRRLLESGRFPVRSLMLTPPAADALSDVLAAHTSIPVYAVSQAVMNRVTGFNMHRGCLAIGERGPGIQPGQLAATAQRLVALEGIGNADNIGGIFRNALAFGVDGVLLDETSVDPLYRKALRTSMGASLQVPFARAADWPGMLHSCREAGLVRIALTPRPDAELIGRLTPALRGHRAMLVLGNEGHGLSQAAIEACDLRARIPMTAGVDSLNVATAAAIAMYELARTD